MNRGDSSRGWAALKALAWVGMSLLVAEAAWTVHPYGSRRWDLPAWAPHQAFEAAAALGLSWLFVRLERRSLAGLGLAMNRLWLHQFGIGALLGGAIILAAALAAAAFGGVRWRPGAPAVDAILPGLLLYLAVAWSEELRFRGYPFQRLTEALGPWPAQLLFAAYFIHAHWQNPGMQGTTRAWASLNIGLASLLLGYAWMRTGSLAVSTGLHLGWNFVQGPLLGFGVSGTRAAGLLQPELPAGGAWLHGGPFGLEAGLACALAAVASWALLVRWTRPGAILGIPEEGSCPDGS